MDFGMEAKDTLGKPRCLISRSALLHNLRIIRQALSPGVKICAVVKADAYGHGAEIVVDTLCNSRAPDAATPVVDCLAVADVDEAAALPECRLPVLVLRPVENAYMGGQRGRLETAVQHGWVLTVCSPAAAQDVARIAQARGKRANVQLMVNTGMNRAGVEPGDLPGLIDGITALAALRLVGINSHFACSEDAGNDFSARQLEVFHQAVRQRELSVRPIRSVANSGGVFFMPQAHLEMVRPGIALYGIDPTCKPSLDRPLRPALSWTAPLIGIRDIPTGSSVGYGQTWVADKPTRLGLLPVGYADGYARGLSSCGVMLADGVPVRVVGRVSMDLTIIDLTAVPAAHLGDEVTIIDSDPLSPASVYRMAEALGTIPYEILSRIGPRMRRLAVAEFAVRPKALSSSESGVAV